MITLIKIFSLAAAICFLSNVYDIHITTMDGNDLPLSNLQSKKIMIIVLPVTSNADDSAFLISIDSMSRAFADVMTVIGVPSYENGYSDQAQSSLTQFYKSILGDQVILTQGMYTNKASDSLQHPLFSWLTDVNQNTHFDQEVKGVGQKYFISTEGELYGVIGPEMPLGSRLYNKMIQTQ